MIVYPAIDIKGGRCVRLTQGREEAVREYGAHPVDIALRWESEGAEWLHVVDLDAAISGRDDNCPILEKLFEAVRIPIQFGGGLRTLERIERAIGWGASRVVIGTAALENETMLREAMVRNSDSIAVGIDVRDGHVATHGWTSISELTPTSAAKRFALLGVRTFVVTDIAQDGMLTGPNFALTEQIASVTKASVILSGGISSLDDLVQARTLESRGIDGVIVGKALYERRFTLREALAMMYRH
ncbi:MAG: 1-(5-phosphoribosyl)-5-[(5-phosphoribosylamino)methylideneamino]imidazole-4-carboxamide isomerase [Acidobacteriia bacterium]|nr:1-(5-phosphoribosyl)-5-[(5-phosphoribosylamino)methylideneamino]imidazole-4-carboxamide isomerase [Terriglobia bacterium]